MAITRLNNNSISSISALPSGVDVGKIGQVVQQEVTTEHSTNSTSYSATQYTINITPSATSSKILINWNAPFRKNNSNSGTGCGLKLYRGGSAHKNIDLNFTRSSTTAIFLRSGFVYLDSPSSTSQQNYAIYWALIGASESGGFILNDSGFVGTLTAMEVLA